MTTTHTTGAADLPEALRLAKMLEADYDPDWLYETGVDEIAAVLRRLHALCEQQQRELVKESHRTAEQKLRADQMTEQHRHQSALNRDARATLAALAAGQAAAAPTQPAAIAAGADALPVEIAELLECSGCLKAHQKTKALAIIARMLSAQDGSAA